MFTKSSLTQWLLPYLITECLHGVDFVPQVYRYFLGVSSNTNICWQLHLETPTYADINWPQLHSGDILCKSITEFGKCTQNARGLQKNNTKTTVQVKQILAVCGLNVFFGLVLTLQRNSAHLWVIHSNCILVALAANDSLTDVLWLRSEGLWAQVGF